MKEVSGYLSENGINGNECVYWVTGHSREAAIANIIGATYEKEGKTSYTYTFAAPNTTLDTNADSIKTVFTIVNSDDFVPCLPMEAWGYSRYGKTISASVGNNSNYKAMWNGLTGIDYKHDTNIRNTVETLAKTISSGDPRVEAYKYTCSCHGDSSDGRITLSIQGRARSDDCEHTKQLQAILYNYKNG